MNGTLADVNIRWKDGASVCVVMASKGYPEKAVGGNQITFSPLPENMVCFHAGTKLDNDHVITSGGRVLGLTAWDSKLLCALDTVYSNMSCVSFEGMNFRRDIGLRALKDVK